MRHSMNDPMPRPHDEKQDFSPPSAQQFADYLKSHPVNPPSIWALRTPMLIAIGLLVLSMVTGGVAGVLLPWIALAWLFGHSAVRTLRAQALEAQVRRSHELAMLRRYPEALRAGWQQLPASCVNPMMHSQTVAMISHCLDTLGQYDAAIVGYDYLLKRLPGNQPVAVHIGVSRAGAALGAENLSDADDALRKLRGAVEPYKHTAIGAAYTLTLLAQQVRTHHFEDALNESDDLIASLRPLGVEAGYGHALMALCYHKKHQADTGSELSESNINNPQDDASTPDALQQARLWWQRATLLLPPEALVDRYPELKPLRELA